MGGKRGANNRGNELILSETVTAREKRRTEENKNTVLC